MYECPICLDDYSNAKFKIMICGHKICAECETLLIESGQYNNCPICRTPLQCYVDLTDYMNEPHVLGTDVSTINTEIVGHIVQYVEPPPLAVPNDAVLFYMDEGNHEPRQTQRQRERRYEERRIMRRNNNCCKTCKRIFYNILIIIVLACMFILIFSQ